MKKILVVEDDKSWQARWQRSLDDKVMLVSALSIKEAKEQFVANPDIAAIVMDACVPGDRPTTPSLVRKFRETFTGPMIAASSDPDYRQHLMEAGCDHESRKDLVPEKIIEVLGL